MFAGNTYGLGNYNVASSTPWSTSWQEVCCRSEEYISCGFKTRQRTQQHGGTGIDTLAAALVLVCVVHVLVCELRAIGKSGSSLAVERRNWPRVRALWRNEQRGTGGEARARRGFVLAGTFGPIAAWRVGLFWCCWQQRTQRGATGRQICAGLGKDVRIRSRPDGALHAAGWH